MTRTILTLGLACFLSSCQTGDPIWTEESSRLEITRQATGFLPTAPGVERRSTVTAQKEELSQDALRALQKTRTRKQNNARCRSDSYWIPTLTVFDIHGGSRTYHVEKVFCSDDGKLPLITSEDFEAIAKHVKLKDGRAR